jgi:tRNA pseudouridine32 synthase/23S rRNA pseudouridine746 synthase
VIHNFPEDFIFEEPCEFTDPFRYVPHQAVQKAASLVMNMIEGNTALATEFSQGKMLGVLVVRSQDSSIGYIAAFSGNIGGRSTIEGFVPPIYDLTDPDGKFRKKEAEISSINTQVSLLTNSDEMNLLKSELIEAEQNRDQEIEAMRIKLSASKRDRERIRINCQDEIILADLIRKSQFEKAEFRRLKQSWEEKISALKSRILKLNNEIESLKKKRSQMSEYLQDWIFRQYIVHNTEGESSSIAEIFSSQGLTAPGGTGECAAPKLLEYAYRNGLKPLAMGEFWYGKSPETAVRTHGHFYPSCTSKCGPLLGFMLNGINLERNDIQAIAEPVIIFEDESIIIVEKPSGMPSVPGLNGRRSLLEWLNSRLSKDENSVESVHRLDMDTSGLMVFAKDSKSAINLRRQFEEHTISKTYCARIYSADSLTSESGSINLPLSPDYDERPRQKVDLQHGKEAYTKYKVIGRNTDGTIDVQLYPHTGRTHQLRIHCAHTLGLGAPILGDVLYGSSSVFCLHNTRLHLHALSINFLHPITNEPLTFTSKELCY